MDWHSHKNKSGLIRKVMALGYSVRHADRLVQIVFAVMADGLRRGEEVEIPGGRIRARRTRRNLKKHFQMKYDFKTERKRYTLVRPKQHPRWIQFTPDETLNLDPVRASEIIRAELQPPQPASARNVELLQGAEHTVGSGIASQAVPLSNREGTYSCESAPLKSTGPKRPGTTPAPAAHTKSAATCFSDVVPAPVTTVTGHTSIPSTIPIADIPLSVDEQIANHVRRLIGTFRPEMIPELEGLICQYGDPRTTLLRLLSVIHLRGTECQAYGDLRHYVSILSRTEARTGW